MNDNVLKLREEFKNKFSNFEKSEENLVEMERWIDKYIHENWVVLSSFHISVALDENGDVEILPKNLFSGLLLELGKVKLDKLKVDEYLDGDVVYLWREDRMYKMVRPAKYSKINIDI